MQPHPGDVGGRGGDVGGRGGDVGAGDVGARARVRMDELSVSIITAERDMLAPVLQSKTVTLRWTAIFLG